MNLSETTNSKKHPSETNVVAAAEGAEGADGENGGQQEAPAGDEE